MISGGFCVIYARTGQEITKNEEGTIEFRVRKIVGSPARFLGTCHKPLEERKVLASDIESEACTEYLNKVAGDYVGQTSTYCPSTLNGAVKATGWVMVKADGTIYALDRGFNDQGLQVWGPWNGPYRFDR
jgi:hypothetical protein